MPDNSTTGQLVKLTIEPYKNIECTDPGDPMPFEVMFNPITLSIKNEIEYKPQKGRGTSPGSQQFNRIKPRDYTFEFIIDGTGAAADAPVDGVAGEIEDLLEVAVNFVGDTHRPYYLKLVWGEHFQPKVVAKSVDVTYTLFNPDGSPLRAKINATFTENIEDTLRVRKENASSPDLTHVRKVVTESKLPNMVYKEYKDHLHYLSVARFNGLNNFRKLQVGSNIKLPPVKITDNA